MTFANLPEYPEVRDIELRDKSSFTELFQAFQPQISEYTFSNLYTWRKEKRVLLSQVNGNPLILREPGDVRYLMSPLFKQSIKTFIKILAGEREIPPLYGVSKDEADMLADLGFTVTIDRDNWDYVYLVEDLIELKGGKFRGKRQNINQCLAEHTCKYVEIDESMKGECLEFFDRWCKYRRCQDDLELEAEGEAIKETLHYLEELPIFGAAIYVDGSLEAFTLGEQLNSDTAVVHFEKANSMIRGLYQLLNNWFCKNKLKEFKWVNREQDLGIPGLRRAKMEYNPHHFIEKYVAYPT